MVTDRHKAKPLYFRPGVKPGDPDGDRDWLTAYAEETGRPVGELLSEALAEYRKRAERARRRAAAAPLMLRAGNAPGPEPGGEGSGPVRCRPCKRGAKNRLPVWANRAGKRGWAYLS